MKKKKNNNNNNNNNNNKRVIKKNLIHEVGLYPDRQSCRLRGGRLIPSRLKSKSSGGKNCLQTELYLCAYWLKKLAYQFIKRSSYIYISFSLILICYFQLAEPIWHYEPGHYGNRYYGRYVNCVFYRVLPFMTKI